MEDCIHVEQLEVFARIGVTDDERAAPQRLLLSMTIWPRNNFAEARDEISNTIDYAALCAMAREFVEGRTGRLIETLAHDLAQEIIQHYSVRRVGVEVRKFVVPDTKYVSVSLTCEAQS